MLHIFHFFTLSTNIMNTILCVYICKYCEMFISVISLSIFVINFFIMQKYLEKIKDVKIYEYIVILYMTYILFFD